MRVSRRCPSWRRYFRPRFGFRTFIVSLAAVYVMAMYVFHASLDGSSPRRYPPPVRRWEAGGADDVIHQQQQQGRRRRRVPVERLDDDLQAAFDDIRRADQERQPRDGVRPSPGPSPPPDVNVPASCSAEQRLRRGDDFLPIAGAFLLSAFWDERPNDFDNRHNGTLVRLMAVVREGAARALALVCDFGGSRRTPATVYEMCENHHRPYGSYVLSCRVPDDVVEAPCFVTVAAAGDKSVDVPVRTLRPRTASHSFSVCVPPLFGDVPPDRLVEFFELTFILGADHVVLYELKTSSKTHDVVRHYAARCRDRRRCRVDVIDWRLPESVTNNIWYNGQSLAIQDCLYRQMASSRYVVFSDLDEFLVPRGRQLTNWTDLARTLERPLSCGFQFNSAFFDPAAAGQPPVDGGGRRRPDLLTMRATQRSRHFSTVRTKCMVRPYEIFEAGIHHVSKPIWAHLTVERVDTDVALLHHYRKCFNMFGMNCEGVVEDDTARRYLDELTRAVSDVSKELVSIL